MNDWLKNPIIEDGLIDQVWKEGLRRFDNLMRNVQGHLDSFIMGGVGAVFGFCSDSIRGTMDSQIASHSASRHTAPDIEPLAEIGLSPKISYALAAAGLDFGAISGFGEVDGAVRGCASPLIYMASTRAPSQGMQLMRA